MRTANVLAPIALAISLLGATVAASPAHADVQGADTFRVAGRYGAVHLMNGPAAWSGVEVDMPAGACNIRATGVREGLWLQVSYRASNGYDYTGWADARFLEPDRSAPPVEQVYADQPPAYDAYAPPAQVYVDNNYTYIQQPYRLPPQRHDDRRWYWEHRDHDKHYGY